MTQYAGLAALPPKHWYRAREVASVLAHYRTLPSPTIKDIDAAASKLKIKRRAFYYILQRSDKPSPKAPRKPRVHPAGKQFSGRTLLKKQRAQNAHSLSDLPNDERIVVDYTGLELAITMPAGKAPAYLTVVLDRSNGVILGHCLGLELPSPVSAFEALLDWKERTTSSSFAIVPAITMHSGPERDWSSLRKLLRQAGVRSGGRSMKQLSKGNFLFERLDCIGRIPLRPRLNHERLTLRIATLPPVSLEDARRTVAQAIALWNGGRAALEPLKLPETLSGRLADQIR